MNNNRIIRIKSRIAMFIINGFLVGPNPKTFEIKRKLLNWSSACEIGKGTKVVGPIVYSASVKIGENCWIGSGFAVYGNGEVYIADCCDLAPNVHLYTGSHNIGEECRRAGQGYNGKITVGNGCWIGAETVILTNINIGDGVVIGAHSTVISNINNNVLVAGSPALVKKNL